jgi:hypothetical protein
MITLHGGEPVLNPDIIKIAEILTEYHKKTGCRLWLLTNNSSPAVRRLTTMLNCKFNIPLGISTKIGKNIDGSGSPIKYVAVNEAPCDLGIEYDQGCFQTSNCGVCYNYLGYFPCSPMAAAARVFGYPPTAKTFKEFTEAACVNDMKKHCRLCGFSAPGRCRVVEQVTSQSWETVFTSYKKELAA